MLSHFHEVYHFGYFSCVSIRGSPGPVDFHAALNNIPAIPSYSGSPAPSRRGQLSPNTVATGGGGGGSGASQAAIITAALTSFERSFRSSVPPQHHSVPAAAHLPPPSSLIPSMMAAAVATGGGGGGGHYSISSRDNEDLALWRDFQVAKQKTPPPHPSHFGGGGILSLPPPPPPPPPPPLINVFTPPHQVSEPTMSMIPQRGSFSCKPHAVASGCGSGGVILSRTPATAQHVPDIPSKYDQLLATLQEIDKDIRPSYAGSKTSLERLRRSITQARILVKEALTEADNLNGRHD